MTTHHDLAYEIYTLINESADYSATLWDKNPNETRVYVKTMCRKRKDCGFIRVSDAGIERCLDRQGGTIEALYSDLKSTPITPTGTFTMTSGKRHQFDEDGNDWYIEDGYPEDGG